MTERLYEQDGCLRSFDALVTGSGSDNQGFWAILDRTAFFPEGGGQKGDRGVLGPAQVLDTQLVDGEILHRIDRPLTPGSSLHGELDWGFRFFNMQNHSGEHILSGIVHRLYGCDNVGFHMGRYGVTVDFNRYLTPQQLAQAEEQVNAVIWEDRPVTARYLQKGERMDYRCKGALDGPVRIVTIEGCDCCACCAPHVRRTGQVGLLKILESGRHRGGVRLRMLAGQAAMEDYRNRAAAETALSRLLSAPQEELIGAVQRLLEENRRLEEGRNAAVAQLSALLVQTAPLTGDALVLFQPGLSRPQLCRLADAGAERASLSAAFSGTDREGYAYAVVSRQLDLKAQAPALRAALRGKGGGSSQLLQGYSAASQEEILHFFQTLRP